MGRGPSNRFDRFDRLHLLCLCGAVILTACATSIEQSDGGQGTPTQADSSRPVATGTNGDDTTALSESSTFGTSTGPASPNGDTETTTGAGPGTTGPAAESGPSELRGEDLYFGYCMPCHGPAAEGGEFGPELHHPSRPYSTWVVRNGRPGKGFELSEMLAFDEDKLSDAEVDRIWDWLDSFPPPDSGEGLFHDFCGNCHGADASGGLVDVDLRQTTFEQNLTAVRSGAGGPDYGNRPSYMPAWDEAVLSAAQIELIVEYVNPAAGTTGGP